MSWHYLRVQGGESSQDICSGGDVLQPLKSKITHAEFYCNGRLMDSYLDSLSGTMPLHLTEDLGAEKSMSSQGDSLAKTSALQAEAQDLTENNPQCGITWRGWLAKFDQDSYSWKTAQCSFIEESGESLVTFPVSGMTRSGLLWELPMLAHRTSATERGLWRTPDTGGGGMQKQLSQGKTHRASGHSIQIRLQDQVNNPKLWPTPVQRMYKDMGYPSEYGRNEIPLAAQVGGPLNPDWVEWLMGWPIGWTDLKPLETDKCHFVQQPLGDS
jgi:hypothetical protein